jgi:sortase A
MDNSKRINKKGSNVYNIITGLIVLLFLSLIVYFIGYPLLPEFVNIQNNLKKYAPYKVGYRFTLQSFLSISPPGGEFISYQKDPGGSMDNSEDTNNAKRTMENIKGKSEVELADLEKKETRLVIPSASIEGDVVVGKSQEAMLEGFWHFPLSSIPDTVGNTVIFGHRFDKIPPEKETFYNLDKVNIGDKIYIRQKNDKEISYTIIEKYVVEKNDRSVLQESSNYRLTLITCTPLWTAKKRLVVVAIQDEVSPII